MLILVSDSIIDKEETPKESGNYAGQEELKMKIQEIIDKLKDWHEPFIESPHGTRDQILTGDPDQECTGVAVTVCATMEVLRKAAARNINFIITHESIFFGSGNTEEMLANNAVAMEKKKFADDHGLVVWRDHDRLHGNGLPFQPQRVNPDSIFTGILSELGWENYVADDPLKPLLYQIPPVPAQTLADFILRRFELNGLRIVGNLDCEVSSVLFCEHVTGSPKDAEIIRKAEQADVLIPFEICDYTLTQYVIDAAAQGRNKVLLEMGHFNCEELGMKAMARWLPEVIGNALPVTFIKAGDKFQYRTAPICSER